MNTTTKTEKLPHTQIILQSFFHLPPQTIQICDKYYILYWESRYLYTQLLRNEGRVIREKISYTPIFQGSLKEQDIRENPEMQIRLSFRRLRGKIGGIVLIDKVRRGIDTPSSV